MFQERFALSGRNEDCYIVPSRHSITCHASPAGCSCITRQNRECFG